VVHGGSTMASMAVTGEGGGKGCSTGTGAPFMAAGGGWQWAARVAVGGGRAVAKSGAAERRQPWLELCRHGRCHCWDRVADERGPRGFVIFLNYPNRLKIGN
jgi:hypothetical protein